MATYKTYQFHEPKSTADAYKDYMPLYRQYSYSRPTEKYSDATSPYAADIQKAQSRLTQIESGKPGAYSSAYGNRIDELINDMANRKFSYDLNGDALYQQYKHSYMQQGKQAMADTMGQAAALTGGYGNSYAASVGNQAYQSYLNQLNDRIPELYQLALSRYNAEGEDKRNLYSMMANQESQDYAKYRDRVADYQTDRGYYDQQLQNLRAMGQNLWGQNWDNYLKVQSQNDANYQHALSFAQSQLANAWDNYRWGESQTETNRANAVAQDQWEAEQAEKIRQFNEQMAQNQRQFEAEQAQSAAQLAYQREKDEIDAKYAQLESDRAAIDSQKRINNFKDSLMSESQLRGSRGNYHGYSSYKDYVKTQLDKNKDLTPDERAAIIDYYKLYDM